MSSTTITTDGITTNNLVMSGKLNAGTTVKSITDATNGANITFKFSGIASVNGGTSLQISFTASHTVTLVTPCTIVIATNDGQNSGNIPVNYTD